MMNKIQINPFNYSLLEHKMRCAIYKCKLRKVNQAPDQFISRNGKYKTITCKTCRETDYNRRNREKLMKERLEQRIRQINKRSY